MTAKKARLRNVLAGALALAAVAGVTSTQAADDPANVIKYRDMVMSGLADHIGAIGAIVKGEVSYTAHIADHARSLHTTSLMLPDVFPEGSDQGETRAKPEIWQDWAKFEGMMNDLREESGKLADLADAGDMGAIGAQLQKVGETCGNCHKPFRKEKQ